MKTQPTNLFNTMKMVIRGKFIAQNAYIQKMEIVNITNLTTNLKALEQRKKEITSKRNIRTLAQNL